MMSSTRGQSAKKSRAVARKRSPYVVEFWRETGIAHRLLNQGDQLEDERRIHQHISLRREFVRERLNESLFIEEATTEGAAALGEIHPIEDHVALAVRTRHRAACGVTCDVDLSRSEQLIQPMRVAY